MKSEMELKVKNLNLSNYTVILKILYFKIKIFSFNRNVSLVKFIFCNLFKYKKQK